MTAATAPGLSFVTHLSIEVGEPVDLGEVTDGHRRMVPILGGTFSGPELSGQVIPGGADHQILRSASLTELDAEYAMETDRGERIHVHNRGIRAGDPADIAALVRGEQVDPDRIYFHSIPRLATASPRLRWINERLFVASGDRRPGTVELDVYVLG